MFSRKSHLQRELLLLFCIIIFVDRIDLDCERGVFFLDFHFPIPFHSNSLYS